MLLRRFFVYERFSFTTMKLNSPFLVDTLFDSFENDCGPGIIICMACHCSLG